VDHGGQAGPCKLWLALALLKFDANGADDKIKNQGGVSEAG
jgi:hypothetical protein